MTTVNLYKKTHTINAGSPPPGSPYGSELRGGSYKLDLKFSPGISELEEPDVEKRIQSYKTTKNSDNDYKFSNHAYGNTGGVFVKPGPICLHIKNIKVIPDLFWEETQYTIYEYAVRLMVYIDGKKIDEKFMDHENSCSLPTELKVGGSCFMDGNKNNIWPWEIVDKTGEIFLATELVYKKYAKRLLQSQKCKEQEWKDVPNSNYTFQIPYQVI